MNSDLIIIGNENLYNFNGLQQLANVRGVFNTISNPHLNNLDGLESLQSCNHLVIYQNPSLARVDALSNLTTVTDHLIINDNNSLTKIHGLETLQTIGNSLSVSGNSL